MGGCAASESLDWSCIEAGRTNGEKRFAGGRMQRMGERGGGRVFFFFFCYFCLFLDVRRVCGGDLTVIGSQPSWESSLCVFLSGIKLF